MSYINDFEDFIGEALEWAKEREQAVIKEWLNKIGFTKPVGYYRDSCNKVMEIYTTRPGVLIGKAGANVIEFQKMLSEEYGTEYKVKFIEIRGDFVNT